MSLGSYAALAVTGHYGVTTILACESVTMAAVVVLWIVALRRRDPRARSMVIAFVVSAAAGVTRAVPEGATRVVGLDPVSLYHLAQMPAMVMLCLALHHRAATDRTSECLGPPHRRRFGRRCRPSTSQPSPGDAAAATAPSCSARRRRRRPTQSPAMAVACVNARRPAQARVPSWAATSSASNGSPRSRRRRLAASDMPTIAWASVS